MLRVLCALLGCSLLVVGPAHASDALADAIRTAQRRVVKIYGAGGRSQMEAYQSGVLVSPAGHVLTAMSYVLDADEVTVVLDDGARTTATWVGGDPVLELAVLKLPPADDPYPHYALPQSPALGVGDRVLAVSNLYGIAAGEEPASVLHGVVSAIAPLAAGRGRFQANYRGSVYVVDAHANNPGAAGGALVDWQGRLAGILGKELRSTLTGAWLNYALPVDGFVDSVDAIINQRSLEVAQIELPPPEEPLTATDLGLALVPNLLPRTPPYVDSVLPGSPAAAAGLEPDDLIVFVGAEPTASCTALREALGQFEQNDEIRLSALRDGQLLEFTLSGADWRAEPESPKSSIQVVDGNATSDDGTAEQRGQSTDLDAR